MIAHFKHLILFFNKKQKIHQEAAKYFTISAEFDYIEPSNTFKKQLLISIQRTLHIILIHKNKNKNNEEKKKDRFVHGGR